MSDLLKPCIDCGSLSTRTRCPDHHQEPQRWAKGKTAARGYDGAWNKLSQRARRLQPFCTDCGTKNDLTADHSPEAWQRKENGKPIRLQDITVRCRPCNSKQGPARDSALPSTEAPQRRGPNPRRSPDDPRSKAEFPSHIVRQEVGGGDQGRTEGSHLR